MIRSARRLQNGFFAIGTLVSVGALVALGCGEKKSEAPAPETPAAPAAPAQPAPSAAAGQLWMNTLPANFPEDVPQYPGATVVKAQATPDSGIKVSFSTPDDAAKVASYYSDNFAAQGWSSQRVDAPDGSLVFADKGARSATVGIGAGEGTTKIDLMVLEMR